MANTIQIPSELLTELCTEILVKNGVPQNNAVITVKALVDADLNGVNSHGILRLPNYIMCLQDHSFEKKPEISIVKETKSTAVLDGGNGLGQVVSQEAINLIIDKVNQTETFAVSVRNSNHFGAAGYWADQLQRHNLIGIVTSNVPPIMPVPGGAEAKVGNNPISIAVPTATGAPILLDMATSTVPFGRILNAKNKGESIPEGWAVNSAGRPTTDPDEVLNGGSLFPVGGPKGYGLSVIIEVLTALLSDGAIGSDIGVVHTTPTNVSHFFLGIRIDSFMDPEIFKRKVGDYVQFIKSSKLAEGVKEVYLPGELEFLKRQRNAKEGISVSDSVLKELIAQAELLDIDYSAIQPLYQAAKQ